MAEPAIFIQNLNFRYGKTVVLENINLEISENSFLALIGPNGGGKSTLLKLMVGLETPHSGRVKIFGETPKKLYSKIGFVPQNTNLNTNFPITSLEVVLMGHECQKRPFIGYGKHEVMCAESALERVGVLAYKNEKIGDLSGGQRQRVLLARTLCAGNTKILFLDEPTSSLDANGQQQIYDLLKELNSHMTVVVVSHDLEVILNYASHVGYVKKSMTFHDAPSATRDSIIHKLGIKDGHLCEVEILNTLGQKHD